jgi:predicted membrane channel-forming protein YqfA (hemolysin III family)
MSWRSWVLIGAIFVAVFVVFLFPAIPQSEAYHNFADTRAFLSIPNCLNVLSNAFFLLVGSLGILFVLRRDAGGAAAFVDPLERWPYFVFFVGVTLTAFGSSYYHLDPNDHTLVWDRIPMTVGFMALVAAMLAERINVKLGVRLLVPLVALGAASVVYWDITQSRGHGDLRPYALAQFGSLLVLLLLIALFPPRYTRTSDLGIALALYALAKVLEAADKPIFAAGHIVSGHTLKHLAAALSTYWILRMLRLRAPLTPAL